MKGDADCRLGATLIGLRRVIRRRRRAIRHVFLSATTPHRDNILTMLRAHVSERLGHLMQTRISDGQVAAITLGSQTTRKSRAGYQSLPYLRV